MDQSAHCRMCHQPHPRPAASVGGYRYYECSGCGFVFTDGIHRPEAEAFYQGKYRGLDCGAPPRGWASPEFLKPVFDLLAGDAPQRILDFGAGESDVPDKLRQQGHRVIGVDIAPPERPCSDRLTGCLLEMQLRPRQFDLAYSFQVFEHLPEPRPYLAELLRLTRVGGLVVIHTDMEVPDREQGLERWWYVQPPDHCSLYRHRSFEKVLRGSGHQIVYRAPKLVAIKVGAKKAPSDT